MKNKKTLNEISVSGFLSKFLDGVQSGTQKRFIAQAKKKGVPKHITIRLTKIENEIETLKDILKDL